MGRFTTEIPQKTCEEFYEEADRNGVGGFMLVFVIWLMFLNPLLTLFNSNPVIKYLHVLSLDLHYPMADLIYRINQTLMVLIIIAGIIIGYRVNKLFPRSLEWARMYLLVHLVFVLTMVFVTVPVILTAIEKGLMKDLMPKEITRLLVNMNFRIWTSLLAFGVWYGYLGTKQARRLFYPDKLDEGR